MQRNTERDNGIIEFVDKMRVVSFSTIKEVFFKDKSERTAYQVMQRLCKDYKELDSDRHYLVNENIFWIPKRKPDHLKHALFRSEFFKHMHKEYKIIRYTCELEHFEGIRPDILMSFETVNGIKYNGFLETELNNNGTHFIDKYAEFYDKGTWRQYFATFPIVFTVTNKKKLKLDDKIALIVIDEEFKNFKESIKKIM